MDKNTAVIILAAGKGTRMKSTLPKVLHSIGHKPMVNHVMDIASSLSAHSPILVISPQLSSLEEKLESKASIAVQKEQLGTADAVKSALPLLPKNIEKVAILYADTPLVKEETIKEMLETLTKENVACVLGFRPDDPAEYGRLVVNYEGGLESIIEYKDASEKEREISLCNSGVIALHGSQIQQLVNKIDNNNAKKEYYLTDVISLARKEGLSCSVVEADQDEVLGVNNREQLSEAEYIFQSRKRKEFMLNGVTLHDPETTYFAHDTSIENDVTIEPNVFFGEKVSIASGVHIKAFSHIEGTKIGKNTVIGPFARLRPDTRLAPNTKVGNFVEIKKSNIKEGSKINHLSYIGDAIVEKNVNIGAGTITCNYDGQNKYQTHIEEGAFIGSNTALVAPITVGKNVLVAAGSTLTKNVEKDHLAIGRSKQTNLPKKPKK